MSALVRRALPDANGLYHRLKKTLDSIGIAQLAIAAFLTAFTLDAIGANPLNGIHIESFNRQIGQATAANWDVGRLISHFLALYLVVVPLLFFLFLIVVAITTKGSSTRDGNARVCDVIHLAAYVSGYGLMAFLLRCARTIAFPSAEILSSTAVGMMVDTLSICAAGIGLAVFWCAVATRHPVATKVIEGDVLEWALALGLALALPFHLLVTKAIPNLPLWLSFLLISVIALCTIGFVSAKTSTLDPSLIRSASIPLFLSMIAMSLCIEAGNVANQHSITIPGVRKTLFFALCILLACSLALAFALRKRKLPDWRVWFAPLTLIGLVIISEQPELQTIISTDFFESSNTSASVSQFFLFGEIPIIETHGAHMLNDYIWYVLFGCINSNPVDASFVSYSCVGSALTSLLLFYIMRELVGIRPAFFAVLLLPMNSSSIMHLSFLAFAGLIVAVKRNGYFSVLLFWNCVVIGVLYRGDYGLAAGIGAAVALFCFLLYSRDWHASIVALATLALTALCWLLLFALLCIISGLDPVARLGEFLGVMASSNQNWARSTIGNNTTAIFTVVYVLVPAVALFLTIGSLLHNWSGRGRNAMELALVLLVGIAVSYYANVPRALVRHSLAENDYLRDTTFMAWVIAISFLVLTRNLTSNHVRAVAFPCILLLFPVVLTAIGGNALWGQLGSLDAAVTKYDSGAIALQRIVDTNGQYKRVHKANALKERAVLSSEMKQTCVGILNELDSILGTDDTWVDFTNQTTLYALAKRNNPVYINQSPGLLAGDVSQNHFIQEVEAAKPLVTLMPSNSCLKNGASLDGIMNAYRYYKVSEYIHSHYIPYEVVGDFAIWIRNGKSPKTENSTPIVIPNTLIADLEYSGATCIVNEDNTAEITALNIDPQIPNLSKALQGVGHDWKSIAIEFECIAEESGAFQLFWAEDDAPYSAADAENVSVDANSLTTVRFCVPKTARTRYRLDFPTGRTRILNGISISETGAHRCGYEYAPTLHSYSLGEIPFLWANYDESDAWNSQEVTAIAFDQHGEAQLNLQEDLPSAYIALVIYADTDSPATLALYGSDNTTDVPEPNSPLASFTFNLRKGENRYLIRPSADFYWSSHMVKTCQISGACKAIEARILVGD